jgi:hypothetical protein
VAGGARFQLVTVRSHYGVCDPAWPGAGGPQLEDGSWCAWRLLGGNNRDLGRSARLFPDVPECLASVGVVRQRAGELAPVMSADPDTGMWLWRLELDGVAVAVAARPYFRQREGQYSLGQFLAALPEVGPVAQTPMTRRHERPGASRDPADQGVARSPGRRGRPPNCQDPRAE